MKAVILAIAFVGVASAAPLSAQILGTRLPTPSTTRGTSVDGSWRVVGQDRNGTIYERRTYDGNGNIIVQRARRDANGNFTILSTRSVRNDNRQDCQLASTNGTVGDIILGRSGVNDCRDNRRTADGVWRQVGQGRNNNSVYERRTVDASGNVVVQKARRNPDGTFRILSTRTIRDDRGIGRNRGRDDDDDQGEDNGRRGRGKHSDDSRYEDSNYSYNDGDYRYNDADYRYNSSDKRYNKSEHKNKGRGKGRKGGD
ncbi:MAG TPA: hypothetical protein VGJ62_03220 [Gemmatimonadaceae bacterium]